MRSLISVTLWVLIGLNLFNQSLAQETGSIIPLYIYPEGNNWQRLFDAYRAHPITTWAIVNVYNGPGDALDPNYANSIPQLHSAGINTLGYVLTNYTRRSQMQVRADIDKWKSLYNVKGIFFDEMTNNDNDANVNYYRTVNTYAKSQGFSFTVGNPGTRTSPKYFQTVDNIVIFEEDTGFPSKDILCSQDTNGKGRGSVSIIPYNIGSLNEAQVRDVKSCAGFIYVTNDVLPNPWDTLPNYLTRLFEVLRG